MSDPTAVLIHTPRDAPASVRGTMTWLVHLLPGLAVCLDAGAVLVSWH